MPSPSTTNVSGSRINGTGNRPGVAKPITERPAGRVQAAINGVWLAREATARKSPHKGAYFCHIGFMMRILDTGSTKFGKATSIPD